MLTIFSKLLVHYQHLQEALYDIEELLFSLSPTDKEEAATQEKIAKEAWERDYIIFHTRNTKALAVLIGGSGNRILTQNAANCR